MIYVFLADGFEEIEALCPIDVMRRAGLNVTTVGIGKRNILGSHGIAVSADITDDEIDLSLDIDLVFLPGGMPGAKNLDQSPTVHKALDVALEQGSYIAAICAAPMILGKRGMLNGKSAICYPSFEKYLDGASISDNEKIVLDGKIITAKGMGVATDLGLKLVELLCDKATSDTLRTAIIAD